MAKAIESERYAPQTDKEAVTSRPLSIYMLTMLGINLLAYHSHQETPARRYEITKTVVSVDHPQQVVAISHEEIVQSQETKIRPFTLKQKRKYNALISNDCVQAITNEAPSLCGLA